MSEIVDKFIFKDEAQNGALSEYIEFVGEKGNDDIYLADTNGNDCWYRLILYVNQEGVFYSEAGVTEDLIEEQGYDDFEIEQDGYVYPYSDYPVDSKELIDWIDSHVQQGIETSIKIYDKKKEKLLQDLIKIIENKDFGMIGYVVYYDKNNKIFEIHVAESRMGIDFDDENDLAEYEKQTQEAYEYANKTYYPLITHNFPELEVIIKKESF